MKVFPVSLAAAELTPIASNCRRALLWQHGDDVPAAGDTLRFEASGGRAASCHRIVTDVQLETAGAVVSFRPLTKIEKGAAS